MQIKTHIDLQQQPASACWSPWHISSRGGDTSLMCRLITQLWMGLSVAAGISMLTTILQLIITAVTGSWVSQTLSHLTKSPSDGNLVIPNIQMCRQASRGERDLTVTFSIPRLFKAQAQIQFFLINATVLFFC